MLKLSQSQPERSVAARRAGRRAILSRALGSGVPNRAEVEGDRRTPFPLFLPATPQAELAGSRVSGASGMRPTLVARPWRNRSNTCQ